MKSLFFLRYFFSFCYFMSILGLVVGGIGHLINIFFGVESMFQIPFTGVASFDTTASYELLGNALYDGDIEVKISLKEIVSKTIPYKVFGFVNTVINGVLVIYLLKYLTELFGNFSEANKWGEFFTRENSKLLNKLPLLMLSLVIYMLAVDVTFAWVLLKDFKILGEQLVFHPDLAMLSSFITVFVLFGVARIYKAAVEMKEESEFTI